MNRSRPMIYLLAIASSIALTACDREAYAGRSSRSSVTVTRSWPAAEVRALSVAAVDGSVSIEASETDQVTLVARGRGAIQASESDENRGLFKSSLEDGTLKIGHPKQRRRGLRIPFISRRRGATVNYAFRVPPSVSLQVRTVNGRITTRGTEGATDIVTVNGRIDVETTGVRELRATTVNGRLRTKFIESFSGARLKSVNGRVQAILPANASFRIDLAQVNGDFESSFPLAIHSNPGRRRVSGEVNGGAHELKITTVNGNVEVSRLNE